MDKRWSASRHIGALGAAIAWAIGELGIAAADLTTLLQTHTPSPTDPFFMPTLDDPARVAWGRYAGMDEDSTPAALAWAVLESAAFEVRHELELLSSLFGNIATLVVVGRAASPLVCRLIASACNVTVIRRDEMSWPALGAAQIAASTLGWSSADSDPNHGERVEPHPPMSNALAARYLEYRRRFEGA
jgi:sugar (pentulose or hexulose) kinase